MFRFGRTSKSDDARTKAAMVLRAPVQEEPPQADPQPAPQTAAETAPAGGCSIKLGRLVDAPLCPKGVILMCGTAGALSRDITDWADQMRAVVMVVSDGNISLDWLREYAPKLDFLLVDSDYLGDTEATIDFCLRVRRATPSLPLILVSSEVRSHDFTCERMMACDVTLKPPLMRTALTMGVQAAYQNNEHFLKSIA